MPACTPHIQAQAQRPGASRAHGPANYRHPVFSSGDVRLVRYCACGAAAGEPQSCSWLNAFRLAAVLCLHSPSLGAAVCGLSCMQNEVRVACHSITDRMLGRLCCSARALRAACPRLPTGSRPCAFRPAALQRIAAPRQRAVATQATVMDGITHLYASTHHAATQLPGLVSRPHTAAACSWPCRAPQDASRGGCHRRGADGASWVQRGSVDGAGWP